MKRNKVHKFALKWTALVLTSVLLSQTLSPSVYAGDTLPYEGESAKGPNQPYQHGYASSHILDWTPTKDVYGDMLRARVPLQQRNSSFAATQAQPALSPDTQMFTLSGDYGNAFLIAIPIPINSVNTCLTIGSIPTITATGMACLPPMYPKSYTIPKRIGRKNGSNSAF